MPVSPDISIKVTCQQCGWNVVIPQMSDVIMTPKTCPRCDNTSLQTRKATAAEQLMGQLARVFRQQ